MALPRILFAVPLIVAGALIPAAGHTPAKVPAGAVGMRHEDFRTDEVRIHQGQKITFVNNSRYMHIIGPGRDGTLAAAAGEPVDHRVLMQTNARYTTPAFNVPGTYYTTCSMHPKMTIKIVVTQ